MLGTPKANYLCTRQQRLPHDTCKKGHLRIEIGVEYLAMNFAAEILRDDKNIIALKATRLEEALPTRFKTLLGSLELQDTESRGQQQPNA